jgi:hypothetical protein
MPGPFPFTTLTEAYAFEAQARKDIAFERRARGEPERGNAGLTRLGAERALHRRCTDLPGPCSHAADGACRLTVDIAPRNEPQQRNDDGRAQSRDRTRPLPFTSIHNRSHAFTRGHKST